MEQAALSEEDLYYTDMSVGEILYRARVYYDQSIPDIEKALRIRACQIEAMEANDFASLPGRVYAIGFIRSYSEYLGLDGSRMVYLFKTQSGSRGRAKPELHFPVTASDTKSPQVWLVILSLTAAIMIILGWWAMSNRDRSIVTEIPAVPEILKAEISASADIGENTEGQMFGPQQPVAVKGIILNIIHNSWVEIKDKNGKAVVSQVLTAGDRYYVPDRPDLNISLGNAGGVRLEVGGKELSPLGEIGEVKRGIPLNAEYLKQQFSIIKTGKEAR